MTGMNVATVAMPMTAGQMLARAVARKDDGGLSREDVMGSLVGGGASSLVGGFTGISIYPHEAGHAAAVNLLFKNARPDIDIFPGRGGVTRWDPRGGLTPLGERFGFEGSRAIVSGAGAIVDTAIAMTTFAAGYALRKKHPMVGRTMMGYAAMTMLNDVIYAASALGTAVARGNDFASLATFAGIHPLVSVAVLAAVLPAEYLVLRAIEKARNG